MDVIHIQSQGLIQQHNSYFPENDFRINTEYQ
jgi:hypothetical protein